MADLADVENALVSFIAQTLYPNGTSQPSAAGGVPAMVYAGWPTASRLDADLLGFSNGQNNGKVHVSVYPTDTERNTTRYPMTLQQQTGPVTTLSLTANGQQVTVGGTISTPQNVMLMVNHAPVLYAVQSTDTLTSIATALAALIAGATSSGAVITLPATAELTAMRVGGAGQSITELRRQERVMQVTVWADTPAHRDLVSQVVDLGFAGIERLTMPDGFSARVVYRGTHKNDMVQKANLFKRDLMYAVEYATTQVVTSTEVIAEQVNATAQDVTQANLTNLTTTYV